jgi:hypothetical protein
MNARAIFVLLVASVASLRGAGFTEPPITFYGKITQSSAGYDLLVTSGELAWTIQPTTGAPFIVKTSLSALSGGYSYRLQIPVEKVPSGFTISSATVPATSALANYSRSGVTLDDVGASILAPAGPTFTFAETQRGKTERVDLQFTGAFPDEDGDGLPDWWEILYGYDPTDPTNSGRDDDGDGMSAIQEYIAGTNPNDPNSRLRVTRVIKPSGIDITWTSVPGRKYRLDSSPTLTGTYTPVSGVITAGVGEMTKNFTHPFIPGEVRRFYKVVVVP